MPPRILILSASVGAGHLRAAQAVELALRQVAPDAAVRNLDVLTLTNAAFRRVYGRAYLDLVNKAPHVLGYFYDWLDRPSHARSGRSGAAALGGPPAEPEGPDPDAPARSSSRRGPSTAAETKGESLSSASRDRALASRDEPPETQGPAGDGGLGEGARAGRGDHRFGGRGHDERTEAVAMMR